MLMTLANSFMIATRMDGLTTAAPSAPTAHADTRPAVRSARLAAFLRRLAG